MACGEYMALPCRCAFQWHASTTHHSAPHVACLSLCNFAHTTGHSTPHAVCYPVHNCCLKRPEIAQQQMSQSSPLLCKCLKGKTGVHKIPARTFMPLNKAWKKELPCSLFSLTVRCPVSSAASSDWRRSNFPSRGSRLSFPLLASVGVEQDSNAFATPSSPESSSLRCDVDREYKSMVRPKLCGHSGEPMITDEAHTGEPPSLRVSTSRSSCCRPMAADLAKSYSHSTSQSSIDCWRVNWAKTLNPAGTGCRFLVMP